MALRSMPNGEVVDVPDDITPEGLANIQKQYQKQAAPKQATTRVDARTQGIQRKARQQDANANFLEGFTRPAMQGLLMGFGDELAGGVTAATEGVFNAVKKGGSSILKGEISKGLSEGASEIGKSYTDARDVERERDRIVNARGGLGALGAEVVGAVANPLGTGAKGIGLAAKGLERVGLSGAGKALAGGAERLAASGAVPQAITSGAVQGGLNAAGQAEDLSQVPGNVATGALLGGATGGAFGAAGNAVKKGVNILSDASAGQAENTAYMRIADLLASGKTDARKVAREIAVTDARGGDAMVQDALPSLRAQAGAISRKPNVSGSNDLIERGDQRITDRRARFGEQVRNTADVPDIGSDALARRDSLGASIKSTASEKDAAGGILDTPLNPTPELQMALKEASPVVHDSIKKAYGLLDMTDRKFAQSIGEDGLYTHIPNMRTFDVVRKDLNTRVGEAMRAGDGQMAEALSYQSNKLKDAIAKANPNDAELQASLASMRDDFQKKKALDLGENVLGRMSREPRLVLRDLKNLDESQVADARVGIIDRLINADTKADPVGYYRSLTRNPAQREVMEFAFGGKGNLGRFDRWVNREVRGTRADVLTAPGRQSETARFAMADSEGGENVGNVLSNAMRGFAFGGTIGAASGVTRTLANIATGSGKMAQEEIAKILLSKGENLVKGVQSAAEYSAKRKVNNRKLARMLAKPVAQVYTDPLGGE